MSKTPAKDDAPSRRDHIVVVPEENLTINLKDRWLATFLAWLIPGMGHLYQGRTAKGLLFMVCILGTFFYGLFALGGGKVVYASVPGQGPYRWQYWCQLGAGLPALPALVQQQLEKRGKPALWPGDDPEAKGMFDRFMAPPRVHLFVENPKTGQVVRQPFKSEDQSGKRVVHPDELAKWNHDLHHFYELGTVYTMIAGLLNILVIYDAAAGPLILLPQPRKKRKEPLPAGGGEKEADGETIEKGEGERGKGGQGE
jgi:hypothetical protein